MMYRKRGKIFALCLTLAMIVTTVTFQNVTSAATTLGGSDRYQTALKIVQAGWTTSNSAIIARGDDLADALAAAPLAYAKEEAPILLTRPDALPTGVLEKLKALKVNNIYIVGGTNAVSTNVQNQLKGFTVKRISGKNRAETSYNVAIEAFGTAPTEVVLADGAAYADALSISSIAAVKKMPILLVSNNKLSASEESYISGKTVYEVGGKDVLDPKITNASTVTRLSGDNRYDTNAAILREFKLDYSKIYIANGTNAHLVDALTGSALAALGNHPIVLVDGSSAINTSLSAVVRNNIVGSSTEVLLGDTIATKAATAVEALKPSPLEVVSIE